METDSYHQDFFKINQVSEKGGTFLVCFQFNRNSIFHAMLLLKHQFSEVQTNSLIHISTSTVSSCF